MPNGYFKYWSKIGSGNITLEEYEDACKKADWFYHFSDQNLSGFHMESLYKAATNNDSFAAIYNREHAKRFNTESFYPPQDKERVYKYPFPEIKPAD